VKLWYALRREVGVGEMPDEQAARDLARELNDEGLAVVCVRAGCLPD
jgi:hypothetical protein